MTFILEQVHLHMFLCFCLYDTETTLVFVRIQLIEFIPFFIPNEILVLFGNFTLISSKLKIVYSVASGACISDLV